ncbi:restriction endonuclease subunit S [Campylobacter concisus]|uniref:restriction endonuclease subunit S n=1 Tax=Campylobacter concisus TaxID=199 RepID=UPI000CD92071|nr:restriction endonuclease subunit S [Campylobacter concisus]
MSEFKNLPSGWRVVRLGDVLKIGSGRDYKHLELGNIPVYGTGGYMLSVDEFLYDGESVCIGRKGTIDKPIYLNCKFWTVDTLFYTYGFKNSLPKFIYYIFSTIDWQKYNEATGVPSLSKNTICNIRVKLPSLDEQKKIAEILSTWDEAINLTINLIESKKQFKKALMQNLLTAKIRFPQFKDEWKETKLGEICEIQTGKLNANAMIQGGRYKFFTCAKEVFEIDDYAFDTEAILVSGNGENVGYIHYFNGKFNAYQRTYVLDKFTENILFIKYFLEFALKRKIEIEKKDGNTPYIVLSTIFGFIVKLPNLNEQQKIAEVLTACDDEINLLNLKLENLKKQQQGLMQKLLSGNIRTKVKGGKNVKMDD